MFSIDQNSHSLWDALPKCQALARQGQAVTHFIEDVDAAFTALGADVDSSELSIARERYHRSGGADWGAALFYTDFLGRQPTEVRDFEPYTGMKTNVLAKKLGRSVDDLYDEFSPSDNWQLIGSSFVGDRDHHRVIHDLTVAETAPFVRELLARARENTLASFPAEASRKRTGEWFDREAALVERLLKELADARLVDLYKRWMGEHVRGDANVRLDLTSRLFAIDAPDAPGLRLIQPFLTDYENAAGLYNDAIAETAMPMRPLDTKAGELPLFAMFEHDGHFVRTGVFLRDGAVEVPGLDAFRPGAGGELPLADISAAGVRCIVGKAMLLVSQVRSGDAGEALALPYRGSMYMPAAHALARKLRDANMLPGPLKPVVRVRLRMLDRLGELDTPIRLPEYLADAIGQPEVPARKLGQAWRELAEAARSRLETFRDDDARTRWQQEQMPDLHAEIDRANQRRRELAQANPKDPELREIWKKVSPLQTEILERTVRRIDADRQLAELDYYDTRGAALPWCVALGGESFYDDVLARAEVYEEDENEVEMNASDDKR